MNKLVYTYGYAIYRGEYKHSAGMGSVNISKPKSVEEAMDLSSEITKEIRKNLNAETDMVLTEEHNIILTFLTEIKYAE